jgi:hypothetical protein
MAYIEENMKLRRGEPVVSSNQHWRMDTGTGADKGKGVIVRHRYDSGAKLADDHLDPQYKVEHKLDKEVSLTNSLTMLTAISSPHHSSLSQIP